MSNVFDMPERVTDYTVNGKCSNCGACCSDFLPLSRDEIRRIQAAVEKRHLKEHRDVMSMGKTLDLTCPFRDNVKKRCDIYDIRPAICREFICNDGEEKIRANKMKYHRLNQVVTLRGFFFGNKESLKMYQMIARTIERMYRG